MQIICISGIFIFTKYKKNIISVIPPANSVFNYLIFFVALYNADFLVTIMCLCFTFILVVGPSGQNGKGQAKMY